MWEEDFAALGALPVASTPTQARTKYLCCNVMCHVRGNLFVFQIFDQGFSVESYLFSKLSRCDRCASTT